MRTEGKYILELDARQYDCIKRGMEFYHRMLCGQVEELNYYMPNRVDAETLREVKLQLFPELSRGASYGWNGGHANKYIDSEQAQSYQIYREMAHFDVVRKGIENVYTSETLDTKKADKPIIKTR